jgi:hypothetical protein
MASPLRSIVDDRGPVELLEWKASLHCVAPRDLAGQRGRASRSREESGERCDGQDGSPVGLIEDVGWRCNREEVEERVSAAVLLPAR